MVRDMAGKSEMYDNTGYTDNIFLLQFDIRYYAKFIATLIRLNLMPTRHGQVLCSNFSQQRFEQLRDGGDDGSFTR